jgi:hypothetical protein
MTNTQERFIQTSADVAAIFEVLLEHKMTLDRIIPAFGSILNENIGLIDDDDERNVRLVSFMTTLLSGVRSDRRRHIREKRRLRANGQGVAGAPGA